MGIARNFLPRSLDEVRMWSASLVDFIAPPAKHFLWDDATSRFWVEDTLYLSWVMLLFAMTAAKDRHRLSLWIVLLMSSCAAIGLALGTELRLTPDFWTGINLPGRWLFENMPFYAGMRLWMRYGVFAIFFVSVMGGIGFAFWQTKVKHKTAFGVIVMLLLAIDIYTGIQPLSQAAPRAVDVWLSQQPENGAVIELPYDRSFAGDSPYYYLTHGKPTIGSFSSLPTPQMRRTMPVLAHFPSEESFEMLTELKVTWIILLASRYADYDNVRVELQRHGYRIALIPDDPKGLWIFEK